MHCTTATELSDETLMEAILQQAADELGDITEAVMALYYSRQPEASAVFQQLATGEVVKLEANMVDSALYCLMTWTVRPAEVEITYMDVVSHHQYLGIPLSVFIDLQIAVVDVVKNVIPDSNQAAIKLLDRVATGLVDAIENAAE
jgi:hypothetical protein